MTRRFVAGAILAVLAAALAFDLMASAAPNPYGAPTILSLGSGQDASGTHCSMLDSAPPAK